MTRPRESDYTSHTAYTRALEVYCDWQKELIAMSIDALRDACGGRCNAEYNPCHAREALTEIEKNLEGVNG
jgi:hypothetical protein